MDFSQFEVNDFNKVYILCSQFPCFFLYFKLLTNDYEVLMKRS